MKWYSTPSPNLSPYIFLGLDPSPPPLEIRHLHRGFNKECGFNKDCVNALSPSRLFVESSVQKRVIISVDTEDSTKRRLHRGIHIYIHIIFHKMSKHGSSTLRTLCKYEKETYQRDLRKLFFFVEDSLRTWKRDASKRPTCNISELPYIRNRSSSSITFPRPSGHCRSR